MDPIVEPTATTSPTPNRSSHAVRDALAWDRVMLRNDLRLYIRQAWHVVEPPLVSGSSHPSVPVLRHQLRDPIA